MVADPAFSPWLVTNDQSRKNEKKPFKLMLYWSQQQIKINIPPQEDVERRNL